MGKKSRAGGGGGGDDIKAENRLQAILLAARRLLNTCFNIRPSILFYFLTTLRVDLG